MNQQIDTFIEEAKKSGYTRIGGIQLYVANRLSSMYATDYQFRCGMEYVQKKLEREEIEERRIATVPPTRTIAKTEVKKRTGKKALLGALEETIESEVKKRCEEKNQKLASLFDCPITMEVMRSPTTTPCGHTFEHSAIMTYLENNSHCPMCRTVISQTGLVKNIILEQVIRTMFPDLTDIAPYVPPAQPAPAPAPIRYGRHLPPPDLSSDEEIEEEQEADDDDEE